MEASHILLEVAMRLARGEIEVVDLTAPLGPDTPLLKLPLSLKIVLSFNGVSVTVSAHAGVESKSARSRDPWKRPYMGPGAYRTRP